MIRFLPLILIPVIIISGLGYWRYLANKQSLQTPQQANFQVDQQVQVPAEVPNTLPKVSLEDQVNNLEDTVTKLVPQVNSLKSASGQGAVPASLDSRLKEVESVVAELKTRVSLLEKGTTTTQSTSKSATVYIPLGAGGQNGDKNWLSIANYGATIDPAEYPGYTSMQLEVNFRLVQKSGTAYARLYNVTDQANKEQVSTTSDSFSWQTSSGFTLPTGQKTYTLQMKSTEGAEVQLQSARIKVNF